MKILLLNCVYGQGSTGKIIASLQEGLTERGNTAIALYGTGKEAQIANASKICYNWEHKFNAVISRLTGIPFGGFYLSNYKVEKIIEKEKPDVVHLHCINGSMINVYELLSYLGKKSIKTVVTLHAEFFHTGSCSHAFDCQKWITGCYSCDKYKEFLPSFFFEKSRESWQEMRNAFAFFNKKNLIITSVSPWLMDRAKQSGILGRFEHVYIPNGIDVNVFKRVSTEDQNKPSILFVAPHFEPNNPLDQKGGRFLLEIANRCSNYTFKIIASKSNYLREQLPPNIKVLGCMSNQNDLCKEYCQADVTLILSKRETFSMVTAESLCCGTPVVGFKAGGPETIALEKYSSFVEYGSIDGIVCTLQSMIDQKFDKEQIAKHAAQQYAFNKVTELYINEYKKLINE